MSTDNTPYIVVAGIDFSAISEAALQRAFDLAERHAHAQLHVITVGAGGGADVKLDTSDTEVSVESAAKELKEYVEEQLKKAQPEPFKNLDHVVTHLGTGDPATEITELAAELGADLIVVGTHGRRGFQKLILGSVAEKVLRMAHAPVLIVRPKDYSGEAARPHVEPPCPKCAEVRAQSGGRELWCEQHRAAHGRRHTYHFSRSQGARNSGFLIPM